MGFHGNELVHLQTIYTVGAVVGQIPFAWLFTKIRMHWLLPGMDMAWGVFTLLQYRSQGYSELMAYRFLIGFFEVCSEILDFCSIFLMLINLTECLFPRSPLRFWRMVPWP